MCPVSPGQGHTMGSTTLAAARKGAESFHRPWRRYPVREIFPRDHGACDHLSHLVPGLTGRESMSATNTMSAPAAFAPFGSPSESVDPIDVRTPGPEISPAADYRPVHPSDAPRMPNPGQALRIRDPGKTVPFL